MIGTEEDWTLVNYFTFGPPYTLKTEYLRIDRNCPDCKGHGGWWMDCDAGPGMAPDQRWVLCCCAVEYDQQTIVCWWRE